MYSSSFRLTNRDIDLALEANHLFPVFQPKIDLASGRVLGVEAYIRWNHPEYGLLPPGLFLSFFERRERSVDLTRFVVSAAADAILLWRDAGQHWPVSINLSGSDLNEPGLPGQLAALVGDRGLDTGDFTLEVPEGAFARNAEVAARMIAEFRRLGFRTALDGGGAVIVPVAYITPTYFSEIKISGAAIIHFAQRLQHSGLGYIGKRVALAASLSLDATAVGVEDATTLSALSAMGFTAAQGTYICRPREAAELIGWHFVQASPEEAATADKDNSDILLLENALAELEQDKTETRAPEKGAPLDLPLSITLAYEDFDLTIPGLDGLEVCARALDPVCFFPGRHLVALLRRPSRLGRRIPGIDRPIRLRVRRPRRKKKGFLARAFGF